MDTPSFRYGESSRHQVIRQTGGKTSPKTRPKRADCRVHVVCNEVRVSRSCVQGTKQKKSTKQFKTNPQFRRSQKKTVGTRKARPTKKKSGGRGFIHPEFTDIRTWMERRMPRNGNRRCGARGFCIHTVPSTRGSAAAPFPPGRAPPIKFYRNNDFPSIFRGVGRYLPWRGMTGEHLPLHCTTCKL